MRTGFLPGFLPTSDVLTHKVSALRLGLHSFGSSLFRSRQFITAVVAGWSDRGNLTVSIGAKGAENTVLRFIRYRGWPETW